MRRSIIISTLLAVTVALLGACDPKPAERPPSATPTPVATASPMASPATSPTKAGEVKTSDGKNGDSNVNKEVKPAETPKAK